MASASPCRRYSQKDDGFPQREIRQKPVAPRAAASRNTSYFNGPPDTAIQSGGCLVYRVAIAISKVVLFLEEGPCAVHSCWPRLPVALPPLPPAFSLTSPPSPLK